MIELRKLKKTYGARTVLDVETLSVKQGETVALAGANGSGKTTLLRILVGRLQQTSGAFEKASPVLYLPQRAYAFRGTVLDNVLLGAKDKKAEAVSILEQMELSHLKEKKATSLSGGELQRLAFCRLLIRPCKLLLLDEPTSACDPHGATLLLQALRQYRERNGCTVLLSTHAPAVAVQSAERMLMLRDGVVAADGKPQTLLQDVAGWMERF